MPFAYLEAYAEMLPRIEAEESMRLVNAVSFAFGSMKDSDSRSYADKLNELGGSGKKQEALTPMQAAQRLGIPILRG